MSTSQQDRCHFAVGQTVVYRPSARGIAADAMTPESEKLVPGNTYRIAEIQHESYIVPEGHKHPGGGIYWTEFAMT